MLSVIIIFFLFQQEKFFKWSCFLSPIYLPHSHRPIYMESAKQVSGGEKSLFYFILKKFYFTLLHVANVIKLKSK